MARLIQLDQVPFPVEEHPIIAKVTCSAGEGLLPVPDKKAKHYSFANQFTLRGSAP
jgi:hypothetical protein